jgi:hypothetical protein
MGARSSKRRTSGRAVRVVLRLAHRARVLAQAALRLANGRERGRDRARDDSALTWAIG